MLRAAWDAGVRHVAIAPFGGVGAAGRRIGNAAAHFAPVLRDARTAVHGSYVRSFRIGS